MMEGAQVMSDHLQSVKHQTCGSRHRSGRTDRLYTPRKDPRPNGTKGSRESDSSVPLHRKHQSWSKDSVNEPKGEPAVPLAWCETPKLTKKDASLRRRLLVSRSSSDGNKSGFATPGEDSRDHNESFDSPLSPTGPLSYSTLNADDFFSCRKRRLLFSQAITSTLETDRSGVHMSPALFQNQAAEPDLDESIIAGLPSSPQTGDFTPLTGEDFRSPVGAEKHVLDTSSFTPVSEDSGFSSLGLDKSHDSSDHDGSFQELVLPTSSCGKDKRRSRLERQRRLSTLREGGSQSEDGHRDQRKACGEPCASKDDVFLDGTPLSAVTLKMQDLSLTPALQVLHAISRRGTRALQQQTSLEDLLHGTEEDGRVKTSLPLSGLIGRKMGLDKVDIISELRMRNLRHVLAVILSLLSAADLYRFGQVSEDWKDVISEDKRAAHRRRSHIRELKIALEGDRPAHVPDADTRSALACRSVLGRVQAQARTPCTPTQSNDRHCSSKRTQFLQVAQTLFSDEYLKPCPRCQHAARCHALRGEGLCSWSDCGFQFCTACLCSFHGSKDCMHLSAKRRSKRDVLPGSAQSKRNVRRL